MTTYLSLLSIELQDNLGVPASHDLFVNVPDTATVANLVTYGQAYCAVLDPVTSAEGVVAHFTVNFPSTGLKTAPLATSEVERTGLFNFSQAGSRYKFGVDVPSIADAVIATGKIDLTNTGVIAWKNFILAAGAGGIQAASKFSNLLSGLLDALISFRKHRKAENRRSFEVAN